MARFTGYGQIGMPTAYAFGGGTIGGPNVWDFSSGFPQLSAAARQAGTITLPAGALSRQEIRNRQDVQQAMMSGRPYVEMPTRFQLSGRGQYVDPLTGQTMGSIGINYSAGGWRNEKGEEMATGGGYTPSIRSRRGQQGGPQTAQNVASPFPAGTIESLTGFGGMIPRFPVRTPEFISGNY